MKHPEVQELMMGEGSFSSGSSSHNNKAGPAATLRDRLSRPVCCRPFRLWHLLLLILLLILIPAIVLPVYFTTVAHQDASDSVGDDGSGAGGAGSSTNTTSRPVRGVVDLGYAQYRGFADATNVTSWLGIRFARPPTGQYRFAAPADPLSETKIQNASTFGPLCIASRTNLTQKSDGSESEDCLFLNLYAPANASSGDKLPVYVFIQGGGFNADANANFNGSALVQAADYQAIVINFNYRVGAYGFLASQEMADDSSYALNAGLLDQRQVLKWVQTHIATFGGDPGHVTLGGASAGAGAVVFQLTAYGGRDDKLFHAAAAESQNFPPVRTVAESEPMFEDLAKNAGCKQGTAKERLACLRQMSTIDFQNAHRMTKGPFPGAPSPPIWYWGPTLDKDFVQDYTYNLYRDGKFLQMPTILGDATDEGTIFTPRNLNTQADADNFIRSNWPSLNDTLFDELHKVFTKGAQYDGAGAYYSYGADLFGMTRYICPGTYMMDAMAKAGMQNIWNYRWDVQTADNKKKGFGATHVGELGPVWGGGKAGTSGDDVHRQFASFIRSYNPNTYSGISNTWQPWGAVGGNNRLLYGNTNTGMEKVDQTTIDKCNVLHSIGPDIQQ